MCGCDCVGENGCVGVAAFIDSITVYACLCVGGCGCDCVCLCVGGCGWECVCVCECDCVGESGSVWVWQP